MTTVPNKTTQQEVLLLVASVSEPLGILTPFTMRVRILLKTVRAKRGQQRHDKIDDQDKEQFRNWVRELAALKKMPRKSWYFDKNYENIGLHFFSDTNLESMCVAAYLRAEDVDEAEVSYVIE